MTEVTFEFDGDPDLHEEDRLQVVDEIRSGDLVCLERVAEHVVWVRTATRGHEGDSPARIFRVTRGKSGGSIVFVREPAGPSSPG